MHKIYFKSNLSKLICKTSFSEYEELSLLFFHSKGAVENKSVVRKIITTTVMI